MSDTEKKKKYKDPGYRVTFHEELANSLSHGFGVLFGVAAMPVLIALAAAHDNVIGIIGAGVFGFSFLFMYTSSTLYHQYRVGRMKEIMRITDHISIYFLIAGTYTPFLLTYNFNAHGITMLAILWVFTVIGIFYKIFFIGRYQTASLLIYLAMGWIVIFAGREFYENIPNSCLIMLAVGGMFYTVGTIFFVWEKLIYHHFIWHLFVLAGSLCHYVAVMISILWP